MDVLQASILLSGLIGLSLAAVSCPAYNETKPFHFTTGSAESGDTQTLYYIRGVKSFLPVDCCVSAPTLSIRWYYRTTEFFIWANQTSLTPVSAGTYRCRVLSADGLSELGRSYEIVHHEDDATCPDITSQGHAGESTEPQFSYHRLNHLKYTELLKQSWHPVFLPCCFSGLAADQSLSAGEPQITWTYVNDEGETQRYNSVTSDKAVFYANRQILTLIEPKDDGIFRCRLRTKGGMTLEHDFRVKPNGVFSTSCSTVRTALIGDMEVAITTDGWAKARCRATVCSRARLLWRVTWADGDVMEFEGTSESARGVFSTKVYSADGFFGNYRSNVDMQLSIPKLEDEHHRALFECVMIDGVTNLTTGSKQTRLFGTYIEVVEYGTSVTLQCLQNPRNVSVSWVRPWPDGSIVPRNTITIDNVREAGNFTCVADGRAVKVVALKVVSDRCPAMGGRSEIKGWSSTKCLNDTDVNQWIFCCLKGDNFLSADPDLANIVQWTRDGAPVVSMETKGRGQFLLANVSGIYRCSPVDSAFNNSEFQRTIVVRRISESPVIDRMVPFTQAPLINLLETREISCGVHNYSRIRWYHNGQPIEEYPHHFSLTAADDHNQTLTFTEKVPGNLTCAAEDCQGETTVVRVMHAEFLRCEWMTSKLSGMGAQEGSPPYPLALATVTRPVILSPAKTIARFRACSALTLECCATGYDSLTWFMGGNQVRDWEVGRARILNEGQVLMVEKALATEYKCVARKGDHTATVTHSIHRVSDCDDECADTDKAFRYIATSQEEEWDDSMTFKSVTLNCEAESYCRFNTHARMSWDIVQEENSVRGRQRDVRLVPICSLKSSTHDGPAVDCSRSNPGDEVGVDCEVDEAVQGGGQGQTLCPSRYSVAVKKKYSRYRILVKLKLTVVNVTEEDKGRLFQCGVYSSDGVLTQPLRTVRIGDPQPISFRLDPELKFWMIFGMCAGAVFLVLVILAAVLPVYCWPFKVCCKNTCEKCCRKIVDRTFSGFICYDTHSKEDTMFAMDTLRDHLEGKLSYSLCIPERDFSLGEGINEQTSHYMDDSQSVIAVVSESSITNGWCDYTLGAALRSAELSLIIVLYKVSSASWRNYQENRLRQMVVPNGRVRVLRWPRPGCYGRSVRDERAFLYKLEYAMPARPKNAGITLVNTKISALQY